MECCGVVLMWQMSGIECKRAGVGGKWGVDCVVLSIFLDVFF